jgi:hypothetical protein
MTSKTGNQIRFRAHHQLACEFYRDQKILSHVQFNAVDWTSVHCTLPDLLRLFQVWAAKHVLGIAGTTKFLVHQDGRSPMCPSCNGCMESCSHVTRCPEEGRMLAFEQSAQMMGLWLEKNNTHPDLQSLLLWYLHGRGFVTCSECSKELNLPLIIQEFAASQDVIGWDGFIMEMVSSNPLPIQSAHLLQCNSSYQAARWISGVITQLLQVTHSQWIYQCVVVHDHTTGTLISSHKEKLLKEIDHQLTLGPEGLSEEDQFLLECNFDELTSMAGEQQ